MGFSEKVSPSEEIISSASQKGVSKGILKRASGVAQSAHAGFTSIAIPRDSNNHTIGQKEASSSSDEESGGSNTSKKLKGQRTESRWKRKAVTMWRRFSCLFLSPIFIRHRNRVFTLIEVFLPAIIGLAIIAAFTSGISWKHAYYEKDDSGKITEKGNFPRISLEKAIEIFRQRYVDKSNRVLIFFSPKTNLTQNIMQNTLGVLGISPENPVDMEGKASHGAVALPNSLEVFERSMMHNKHEKMHPPPIGLVFHYNTNDSNLATGYPLLMKVFISTFNESISDTRSDFPYVQPSKSPKRLSPYVASGFIGLQYALHRAYVNKLILRPPVDPQKDFAFDFEKMLAFDSEHEDERILNAVEDIPSINLQMYFYPNFFNTYIRLLISLTVGSCLVVAYLFTTFFIVRQIVQEKKTGIKELLKIHGMPVYMHWVILVGHCILFRGLTAILMTSVLFLSYGNGQILHSASFPLIFLILWGHLIALTFSNYLLAACVKSVSGVGFYSVATGLSTFIVPYILSKFKILGIASHIALVAACPNWALYNIIQNIVEFECDDQSFDWKHLHSKDHIGEFPKPTLRTSVCLILMCGSGVFYLLAAIYLDMTSQMSSTTPGFRCWHLFRSSKQMKLNQQRQKDMLKDLKEGKGQDFLKPKVFEDVDPRKKCLVRIRNLCKKYGEHVLALDSLNLNILHNEITVVLGHSGCGKTTLISILAGLMHPTTGYATIENFDVSFNSARARHHTGLCSQQLSFFNLLTVKQHVFMCYRLRGYSKQECTRHTSTLLIKLRLWSVRGFYPDSLTTDELRRLGISMAMADAPTVLLLDEPTVGMDAFGRREIWTILKSLRKNHTIIFTTNYMDEAEVLADRIAFLSHGRLICFGSVDYLRQQYDTGYFLKLHPLPHIVQLDAEAIVSLLRARLGNNVREKKIKTREDVDTVIVELPRDQLHDFGDMCDELDEHQLALGIKKYSIKQVGLNDIFIQICEAVASEKDAPDLYVRRDSIGEIKTALAAQIPDLPLTERFKPRIRGQVSALLVKRWTYMKTKNDLLVLKWIVPLCLLLMVVWESQVMSTATQAPEVRDFLKAYDESTISETFFKITEDHVTIGFRKRIEKVLGKRKKELLPREQILLSLKGALDNAHNLGEMEGDVRQAHSVAVELSTLKSTGEETGKSYQLIGYHASGALHSAPTVLDLLMNIILSSITPTTKQPYRLHIVNDPFPDKIESENAGNCDFICIMLAVTMSLAYCLMSSAMVTFPMRERAIGIKFVQLMTGVHPAIYWCADYICDCIPMLTVTILVGTIFYCAPNKTYDENGVVLVLLLFTAVYFLWTGLAFSYLMSSIIPLKYIGFNFLIVMHVIFGILPFILTEYSFAQSENSFMVIRFLLLLFPGYAITCTIQDWFDIVARKNTCKSLVSGIQDFCSKDNKDHSSSHVKHLGHQLSESEYYRAVMHSNIQFGRCCETICNAGGKSKCFKKPALLDYNHESFAHPNLISDIVALVLTGCVFWLVLIIVEKRIFARLAQKIVLQFLQARLKKGSQTSTKLSKDLRHEAFVVSSILNEESFPDDVAFVIQDLTKSKTASMVINGFNLEVKAGECVGILGSGGSGKSAIIKMITGESIPTKGMCYIANSSLINNRKQYFSSIGYCAQHDTLFESFTGIQMLTLMGRLRGIPSNILPTHVAKWLNIMGLGEVGHTRCKMYRKGMRRRLCFAMALIGNCPVLVLDEVTTGVDPVARERIWAVLEHLRAIGHTVIFTSFYTQECINLTSKLVILAEGNVQCLGSPNDLRKRFARGFCITIRLRNDVLGPIDLLSATVSRVAELKAAVETAFLHIDLIDEQDNILLYFLRDTTRSWGDVFRIVERVTEEFAIISESYDITQASIEDLFVLLTNKHKEMDNPRKTVGKSEFALARADPQFKTVETAARALHTRT